MTVRDIDRGYKALVERVYGMKRRRIKMGVLEGGHASDPKDESPELSLLFVAICNEFGTTDPETGEVHVPERSFIRAWFDEHEPQIRARLVQMMREVVAGKRDRDQALDLLAQECVGQIQARIADGIAPDNAPSTVERKGSSTPLVNHGQLRAGISYLVEEG